jgi:hypothetical protein
MSEEDVKLAAIATIDLPGYDEGYEAGVEDGKKIVMDAIEELLAKL